MDAAARQRHEITIESSRAASGKASEWMRTLAAQAGLSEELAYKLDLCVVEIVSNIVDHGYGGGPGTIRIELDLSPSGPTLTFRDHAPAFDPLAVPAPVIAASLEDAQVGGLGIHMVRSSADQCHYERRGPENVFTAHFK